MVFQPGSLFPDAAFQGCSGNLPFRWCHHPGPHDFRGRIYLRGEQQGDGEPLGPRLRDIYGIVPPDDVTRKGAGPPDLSEIFRSTSRFTNTETWTRIWKKHWNRISWGTEQKVREMDCRVPGEGIGHRCGRARFPESSGGFCIDYGQDWLGTLRPFLETGGSGRMQRGEQTRRACSLRTSDKIQICAKKSANHHTELPLWLNFCSENTPQTNNYQPKLLPLRGIERGFVYEKSAWGLHPPGEWQTFEFVPKLSKSADLCNWKKRINK